ncbi:MAG: LCP family protein [Eubacteriales bacterium]|nr:LCP family protein [Eubacteriales bacterium]
MKPSLGKLIFSIISKVLVVAILMAGIGFGSYQGVTYYLTGKFADLNEDEQADGSKTTEAKKQEEVKDEDVESSLLFVDSEDGMHTYIIMSIVNVDTNAMDIIYIPENAQVQVGKDIQKKLSKKMEGISGAVEFRDVERIYGDEKYEIITEIIEEMTAVEIDGWDHMSAKNAVSFLDSVSHVSMSFTDSFSYRNAKGELCVIDEGEQPLDGKQAMAYITYLDGTSSQESNRLERSNTYLEKFFKRMLAKKKVSKIIETYSGLVESSKGRSYDALEAALKEGKTKDSMTFRILQGGETDKVFAIDSQKAQLQISTLMKQAASYKKSSKLGKDSDDDSKETSFDEEKADSKDLSIEIYNVAYVQGIAGEWQSYLEDKGYNITLVDTYQQEGPISTTRIKVVKDGIGEDLLEFFPGAEISVGSIDTGGDIQIYIGTDHASVSGESE